MATKTASERLPDIYPSIAVASLVEIFTVTIESNCDDLFNNTCEIYGHITVINDRDNITFDIYNRDKDNPDCISFNETLSLNFSLDMEDKVIYSSDDVRVYAELYDRARLDMLIAKSSVTLNRTTSEHWSEDYVEKLFPGENGLKAKVHYAIFPYAVAATVNVLFFSKDDHFDTSSYDDSYRGDPSWVVERDDEMDYTEYNEHDCSITAKLSGNIFASGAIHRSDGNSPYPSSLLFRTPTKESVEVKSGEFMKLSRSVVAVPGCSSLLIEASFDDGDTNLPIVRGNAIFKARTNRRYKHDIMGENGSRIRVLVSWGFAFHELHRLRSLERLSSIALETQKSITLKRQRLLSEHPSSESNLSVKDTMDEAQLSDISNDNCILPCIGYIEPVLEVYSVVVCSKDGRPFKFYGSVKVDHMYRCCIFEIEKSCPQECSNSGMLAIVGSDSSYSFSLLTNLAIHVDFKDVSGAIISKGFVSFFNVCPDAVAGMRLCRVIRGERGFAAVHYSVFPDGASAVVDVKLNRNGFPVIVKGGIFATYGRSESRTFYNKKLFRSTLFYNVQEGVTLNASDSTLPLVKSRVSLPRLSYLVIKVDISVSHDDYLKAAVSLKRRVEFKCNSDSPREIKMGDLDMVLSVKFSPP